MDEVPDTDGQLLPHHGRHLGGPHQELRVEGDLVLSPGLLLLHQPAVHGATELHQSVQAELKSGSQVPDKAVIITLGIRTTKQGVSPTMISSFIKIQGRKGMKNNNNLKDFEWKHSEN